MAAGRQQVVAMFGNFVAVLENNLSQNPEISINGKPFYEIPAGVAVEINQFDRIEFKNPSTTSTMTLLIGVSSGRIYDNRAYFSGDISVADVTDAVETPTAITALPLSFLINNAAAVDKGGGKVGIPVTSQPFATGESVTIANTTNYNGTYLVDATSSANEVVITATYAAETFDGVNDSIGLTTPRSIAADSDVKELIAHNHDGMYKVFWGDSTIDPANYKGVPIPIEAAYIIPCTGQIYFAAEAGAGKTGCKVSFNKLIRT